MKKLKLTVISDFGAKKFFHAARDYIFENNTKTFTREKKYGSTSYRVVCMREESTDLFGLDTFDHAKNEPRLKGIDAVKANYNSDVIINGNYVWFSWAPSGPSNLTLLNWGKWGLMSDRCDGRLCVGRNILRPPSDDTHYPPYGGATGRYVGQTAQSHSFTFGAGQIPDPPNVDHGIGGLACGPSEYGKAIRQTKENQFIGRGKVVEFASDAHDSGVQPLAGGGAGEWELFNLDGASSVGLVLKNPDGKQQTLVKGDKHNGKRYYVNTYLLFECEKPRAQ